MDVLKNPNLRTTLCSWTKVNEVFLRELIASGLIPLPIQGLWMRLGSKNFPSATVVYSYLEIHWSNDNELDLLVALEKSGNEIAYAALRKEILANGSEARKNVCRLESNLRHLLEQNTKPSEKKEILEAETIQQRQEKTRDLDPTAALLRHQQKLQRLRELQSKLHENSHELEAVRGNPDNELAEKIQVPQEENLQLRNEKRILEDEIGKLKERITLYKTANATLLKSKQEACRLLKEAQTKIKNLEEESGLRKDQTLGTVTQMTMIKTRDDSASCVRVELGQIAQIFCQDPRLTRNLAKFCDMLQVDEDETKEIIEMDARLPIKIREVLTSWVSKTGTKATVEKLEIILKERSFIYCAEKLRDIVWK